MANEYRGEVAIKLGDVEYTLRPSFDVLARIEADLKTGMADIVDRFSSGKYGFTVIEVLIRRGIEGAGGKPPENLKELIYKEGLLPLGIPLFQFVLNAIQGDPKEQPPGEAKAPGA